MSKGIPREVRDCGVVNCERRGQAQAADLWACLMHYKRWKRHGDVNVQGRKYSPHNPHKVECSVRECSDIQDGASDYCKLHDTRNRRHGDPLKRLEPHERDHPRGPRNHAWSGDDATYNAVHARLRASRGAAAHHECVDCGRSAQHWSYDRTDENARVSIAGPYSTDLQRYQPRCVPCHKRFDLHAVGERRTS